MKQKKFHYAWLILLALCVIRSLSAAGINNTGGLFLKPVSDELSVGVGTLSIYFSVSSLATLLFMPFGGKLLHKYGMKAMLSAAIVMQAGSLIALSFMNHVVAWYILSIPLGVGGAILVNLAGPILINRWFRKDAGKALGILMACAGLFGIGVQPLVANLIAAQGWRFAYITVGGVVLAVVLGFILLFIKNSPADKGLQPYGSADVPANEAQKPASAVGIPLQQARKSASFFAVLIFMITITAFGAFNQHMATYGASLGYSIDRVGLILSISMVGSTVGAILIGAVSDKIGVFKTAIGIVGAVIASLVCLSFGHLSFWVLALGGFLMGLAAMGVPVLSPLLTKDFFGEKDYELIYSNVMVGPPLATVVLLPLYGFIYDLTGSYQMVFLLLGALIIIGGASLLIGQKKKQKF